MLRLPWWFLFHAAASSGWLQSSLLVAAETSLLDDYFLAASGLNFTCTYLRHTSPNATDDTKPKNMMLLHGFPMFRGWWTPLLEYWADLLGSGDVDPGFSLNAVACDLRGYSPGASPDNIEEYDYAIFAGDTFELATAAGFDTFDLLGHDHGAGLAWFVAGNDPDGRVESLTVLSLPHTDLLGDALCGDNVDQGQVIASNYFNQFSLQDSATVNNASLTELFVSFGFMGLEPAQFQKMLWWYNASLVKYWYLPRVVSDEEVATWADQVGAPGAVFVQATRSAIPLEERPCVAPPSGMEIGSIEIPTLFICGVSDFALYFNNSYATDFPPELLPNYEHANFECGHDFFLEGDCTTMAESQAVMDKITIFVLGDLTSSGDGGDFPEVDAEPTETPAEDSVATGSPSKSPTGSGSNVAGRGVHGVFTVVLVILAAIIL